MNKIRINNHSLRNLLFLILVGFLLIIILSLTYNELSIQFRSKHEEVLTTAYDLRVTTQNVLVQVSLINDNTVDLTSFSTQFNQGLAKLRKYDVSPGFFTKTVLQPAIIQQNYHSDLDQIAGSWANFLEAWSIFKQVQPSDSAYGQARWNALDSLTRLVTQVDTFSDTLEGLEAEQDQHQSGGQFIFLGLGLVLLAWGGYVVIKRVVHPLSYLDTVVSQIARGDLDQSIQLTSDDELGRLSQSFDQMRREIATAQKLLEDRVQERTRVLTAAFEFSQEIVSQPDMKKIIATVSHRAKDILHARSAELCLATEDYFKFNPKTRSRAKTTGSLIHAMAVEHNVNPFHNKTCQHYSADPAITVQSAPLQIGSLVIGHLCVTRDAHEPFSELEIHTIKLLANSTAVVIANIHLIESERREVELNATLTERQRIASELHDEAAQTLNLLNLKVTELDSVAEISQGNTAQASLPQFNALIEKAQSQMRMAFSGLTAPVLTKSDNLCSDLENYLLDFEKTSGIAVEYQPEDLSALTIPQLIQKQIVYIYREALSNVKRYSRAKNVRVYLQIDADGLHITINDDGIGFDPNITHSDHHFGLSVMQMRAERIGGNLVIETAPGKGTRVNALIPLSNSMPIGVY